MARPRGDLYGNAPDKSDAVLLLIDVINDLEFEGGDQLLRQMLPMARELADLKRAARRTKLPVVYVNDNFGRWRSDFGAQVEHCLHDGVRGEEVARLLQPEPDDYFVLKPRQSGFAATPLELLLDHVGAKTVILTGVATHMCVLFTASDAYQRGHKVVVPSDCVAANTPQETEQALGVMQAGLKACIRPWKSLSLQDLRRAKS